MSEQIAKQINIFEAIDAPSYEITLSSEIVEDEITHEVERIFDYDCGNGTVTEKIAIPNFPDQYQIGLIVGSSGSGKTTILRNSFGAEEVIKWDTNKAIASYFGTFEEASNKFGAVGLNSIPTWLKPYHVLSNGEKFRADMAARLKNGAVIDEFTSVVNREVAVSCSTSIEKYIRKNNLHNVTFCSCHDDIIPYLQPDWIYNTDTHEFYNGRYLCRPKIHIQIVPCTSKAWDMFKRHHYLSGDINNSSVCYLGLYNDIPVCFLALLAFPRKGLKHAWREHRVVVLPDYQGMGIGNSFSESIAQAYVEKGFKYFCKTGNPRMGQHRDHSPLWRATSHNHQARKDYFDSNNNARGNSKYRQSADRLKFHANRICYAHEYIGDGTPHEFIDESIDGSERQMNIFDYIER